jgi:hypothetical protein
MRTRDNGWKLARRVLLPSGDRLHDPGVIRPQINKNMGNPGLVFGQYTERTNT